MPWYEYSQNNSFGTWDINETVTQKVWVFAHDLAEANDFAETLGIYFNGVDEGIDCPCCGDRWCSGNKYDDSYTPVYHRAKSLFRRYGWQSYIYPSTDSKDHVVVGVR